MISIIKGMNDIRPGADDAFLDSAIWQRVLKISGDVLESYGYAPVWLPIVEDTALFVAGIGEETDVVSKEMYTFVDRGGRSLTLRPEGTAGAARAYVQYHLARTDPVQRWWYTGPMFRAERPQKGRYRQFYQIGAELFGVAHAAADAEMLLMLWELCRRLELPDVRIKLNTLGDAESRAAHRQELQTYLRGVLPELCENCRRRTEANPLRVLDCKTESCRDVVAKAPDIMDSCTPEARDHFDKVCAWVREAGVVFERDRLLVRGLDYYTGPIFEFTTSALGAQDAILGGGRYDTLVDKLGGAATAAVGFAAGVERLALLTAAHAKTAARGPHLYLIPMDVDSVGRAFALANEVRARGPWRVEVDIAGGRLKPQMRRASKNQARSVLVVGAQELQSGQGKLKDLVTSTEQPIHLEGAAVAAALAALAPSGTVA